MKHLHRFFSSDASGGIILIIAAVLAMIMANSGATSGWYHDFLETPVQLRVGTLEINKNMLLWINDALMAVFFLLVGLEVKRELMQGSLASLRQAAFPVIAAIGGMIVPALLYLAFNYADPITREGWAIPAATDIAFALGVLALLGSRVPLALKIFLMALAIIDDLGAIIIIALFYTNDLSMASLGVAAVGKPLGISLFCWLALRLKLAHLPEGTTYQQIMAVGILCGIGFTMSIFIASLAFGSVDPELINWAKLGILVGSISSAVIGYSWLRVRLRPSV